MLNPYRIENQYAVISLSNNHETIVDAQFIEYIHNRLYAINTKKGCVCTLYPNGRCVYLGRFIYKLAYGSIPKDRLVIHVDGDHLNNRLINLGLMSHSETPKNKKVTRYNTSGFKGVSFHKKSQKWQAYVKSNKRTIYLGLFVDKTQAALAYDAKALELGLTDYLNCVDA